MLDFEPTAHCGSEDRGNRQWCVPGPSDPPTRTGMADMLTGPTAAEVTETVTSTQLIRLISSMPPVLTGMARAPRPHQDLAVAQIDQSTSQPRSLTVLVPRRLDQPLSGSAALLIVCISAANALAPAGSSNGSLRCASGSTSSSRAAAASSVISSTSAR